MKNKLTAKDLQTLLKVNARKVTRWVNHEPPIPRIRRAGRFYYDPGEVSGWLSGVGFSEYAQIVESYILSLAVNEKPKKEKSKVQKFVKKEEREDKKSLAGLAKVEPSVVNQVQPTESVQHVQEPSVGGGEGFGAEVGVYQTLAIISHELIAHQQYLKTCPPKFKAAGIKMALELSKEVRSLNESCLKFDIATNKVVPISEVTKYIVDMGTKIKSELQTFPSAVASVVAGIDNEDEVEKYLDDKVKSVLRHLAGEFEVKETN